jgi:hypothetical protein
MMLTKAAPAPQSSVADMAKNLGMFDLYLPLLVAVWPQMTERRSRGIGSNAPATATRQFGDSSSI